MLRHLKSKARRGARRVLFSVLCGLCALVGAGFGSAALYSALLASGQTHAMAGLILTCLWFGMSGVFLLLKSAVGEDLSDVAGAARSGAPHVAHPNGHAATAPSVAEAFMAGVNEGAGFARSQKKH
ncbi:hypothetical protein [Tritonibacter horizontis]|uniref:Uncharacterized protein n=1 Tax=Tritonibacter horizontis TaxID=1768241 RepID=A0A132BZU1_9RHOB|nr:hypothetical protein [Tritonibacter horizontis]KUP93853.1 hypothetical protein TRIHO_13450 [Tritonibacter horizontis]